MPGYAGDGQSNLLRETQQGFFWESESVNVGELSAALQLSRMTSMYYPWGFAIEVRFSGDPGTFEIDVMGSETDSAETFVQIGSITTANVTFVARFDTVSLYPRFIALYVKSLTNAGSVTVSAKATR